MAEEESEKFDWSSDAVVIKTTAGIAVYTNPHGDIVIRQERLGDFQNEDSFVVLPKDRVAAVIAALQKEIED